MALSTPRLIQRSDYTVPAFLLDQVELTFSLQPTATRVAARLQLRRNPASDAQLAPLLLYGEQIELLSIRLDGRQLNTDEFQLAPETLQIDQVPESFCLELQTLLNPAGNSALEGLYLSSGNFCTQCEPEGFRKITYYPDRPDVLARFRVRIEADEDYPVLLANGNLVEQGRLEDGRHYALWDDPFPKPSYLFALVAGDLVCLEDHFHTSSGRDVLLQIYVEERNRNYCDHAMQALKDAMRWDQQVYGLEYDLDRYMIVAVDDFNMGAMENKGLNIFNSKYVLAHPQTATDADFLGVQAVIGHEYFHNWTGNRVTCRDWFQLSLKEGLTVFRDQQFSADMNSAAVKRIEDVRLLRQFQFPEDAGPMAHPVRPDSYVEINNFYTTTVYNKGAEVIRMLETLLGPERFIKGVRLYLKRHDGQAVTCDDFVAAMETAGQIDLSQFQNWYAQAGTPRLTIEQDYDQEGGSLALRIIQSCPATPGQPDKQPFQIPVALGLLDSQGRDIPLQLASEEQPGPTTRVFNLSRKSEQLTFTGLRERPVLSPLRGFSAPVRVSCAFTADQLALRMAHDSDPFNRWEAGQTLAAEELLALYRRGEEDLQARLSPLYCAAWERALNDSKADPALLSQLLRLPSEQYLADQLDDFDPGLIRRLRNNVQLNLTRQHREPLMVCYQHCRQLETGDSLSAAAVGRRSLQNLCLALLLKLEEPGLFELAEQQYHEAANMTDRLAACAALIDSEAPQRQAVLADFYRQWQAHPLLLDKWFSLQALSHRDSAFDEIQQLLGHADFNLANPNRVRALLGAFTQNLGVFHRRDGAGYRLLVEQIARLDQNNPQLAARLATPLTRWRRLEQVRRHLLHEELQLLQRTDLSRDLYEIVNKSLAEQDA